MIERKKVLDLCCGAGGLSFGFESHKRFVLLGGVDNDESALKTYRKNFKKTKTLLADVNTLSGWTVNEFFGNADVVLCGFPCQVYSSLGDRDADDERLEVMYSCLRLTGEIDPEMVVLENVMGLINFDQGRIFKKILMFLENLGYVVGFETINMVDFDVPQQRKRLIIVGSKNGKFKFYKRYKKHIWTVGDVLGDLSGVKTQNKLLNWIKKGSRHAFDHEKVEHGIGAVVKINKDFGFGSSYKRLEWDKPATTIVSSFGALSGPRSVHPIEDRALTVREAARLQSFPDKFRFYGNKTEKRRQVANAVPPLFSVTLSRMLWKFMKKQENFTTSAGFVEIVV